MKKKIVSIPLSLIESHLWKSKFQVGWVLLHPQESRADRLFGLAVYNLQEALRLLKEN